MPVELSLFPLDTSEIKKKNLLIKEVMDDGLFHILHRGQLKVDKQRIPVIVKSVKDPEDPRQCRMIQNELTTVQEIEKHPNLFEFQGFVVNEKKDVSIVYKDNEEESLTNILKKGQYDQNMEILEKEDNGFVIVDNDVGRSNNQESIRTQTSKRTADLLFIALEIAKVMEHLTSLSYIHRDITLRSIFIGRDKTVRIGDFGLTRHEEKHYYRIINKDMPLSHHWMAPETFENEKFTEKSDIWSYGVCLWEIFTMGKIPYEDVGDMLKYLDRGRRLAKPDHCNEEIYQFMKKCWDLEPEKRPTFKECVVFFKAQVNEQDEFKELRRDHSDI